MKNFFSLALIFFSFFFVACKDAEFQIEVKGEVSKKFVCDFLDGNNFFSRNASEFDYSFYGISSAEMKEILKGLGGFSFFVRTNLAAEISGFSLKKIFAREGTKVFGWAKFENQIPARPINAALDWIKTHDDDKTELAFRDENRTVEFSHVTTKENVLFSAEKPGEEIDISKMDGEEKAGEKSRRPKFKIKFGAGKITLTPAKKIEGFDVEITISRIRE